MNKTILRAKMNRTRLRNRFLKDISNSNRVAYNTQQNYCVCLVRKAKKSYYSNFDCKKIVGKTFWKTIKPYYTGKGINHNNITLAENEETVSDNKEISETLNNFFSEVVTSLDLPQLKISRIRLQEQSKNIRIIQVPDLSKRIIETQIILFTLRKFQQKKLSSS